MKPRISHQIFGFKNISTDVLPKKNMQKVPKVECRHFSCYDKRYCSIKYKTYECRKFTLLQIYYFGGIKKEVNIDWLIRLFKHTLP